MLVRRPIGILVFLAFALALDGAVSSCGTSSAGTVVASTCSINSDCNSPLACVFARCHSQCTQSRDCPSGERCVSSTIGGICQLSQESTCTAGTLCQSGQVCGSDHQCRVQCTAEGDCIEGDYCLTTGAMGACYSASNSDDQPTLIIAGILAADGSVVGDASVVMLSTDGSVGQSPDGSVGQSPDVSVGPTTDGSSGGSDSGAPDAGNESSVTVNSCPSAQTQFGSTAQGDSNPNFTSGVGVRGPKDLFIFESYRGPDPVGDGGTVDYLYLQTFDPVTANSRGPAQPFLAIPNPAYPIILESAVIAPTGEIAVLYSVNGDGGVVAVFLSASADAGSAGLQVGRTVQLEVSSLASQPTAIWSNAAGAFVFSWQYGGGNGYVKVQKYLPDGRSAGGGTDVLPTNQLGGNVGSSNNGYIGVSGGLYGIPYRSYGSQQVWMTILDSVGNGVGNTFLLAPALGGWSTAAGTPAGFVVLYDQSGIAGTLVAVSPDGGVAAAQTAGGLDAGESQSFQFNGTKQANNARALNDDVGGQKGVGLAILYNDGVAFAYVNADGLSHTGPNDVFAHAFTAGDFINISNYGGSFGVSLYTSATHATEMAASGCVAR